MAQPIFILRELTQVTLSGSGSETKVEAEELHAQSDSGCFFDANGALLGSACGLARRTRFRWARSPTRERRGNPPFPE